MASTSNPTQTQGVESHGHGTPESRYFGQVVTHLIDTMSSDIQMLQGNYNQLNERHAALERTVADLKAAVTSMDTKLDLLLSTLNTLMAQTARNTILGSVPMYSGAAHPISTTTTHLPIATTTLVHDTELRTLCTTAQTTNSIPATPTTRLTIASSAANPSSQDSEAPSKTQATPQPSTQRRNSVSDDKNDSSPTDLVLLKIDSNYNRSKLQDDDIRSISSTSLSPEYDYSQLVSKVMLALGFSERNVVSIQMRDKNRERTFTWPNLNIRIYLSVEIKNVAAEVLVKAAQRRNFASTWGVVICVDGHNRDFRRRKVYNG